MRQAHLYLEHLSDQDLDLIARVEGPRQGSRPLRARLRERPELIEGLLASPRLFEAVLGADPEELSPRSSLFLVFGVLVHRTARDLGQAAYIPEWSGPGRRLPVFDVASLREFAGRGASRFFLIELLSSFVKVASGSVLVRTRRGYRRRRYSELDPVQLADMVGLLPPAQRPGGYRRLGDVTLFLSGVFPDHTATHPPTVRQRERLAASAGVPPVTALDDGSDLRFHEIVGANWYRQAATTASTFVGSGADYLLEVADQFPQARRFLNILADRYLYRYDTGLMYPPN
ncbi:MAG: hypothetical protein WB239_02580 [Acidimicrobiia bacterium]